MKVNIYFIIYLIVGIIIAAVLNEFEECPTGCKRDLVMAKLWNFLHHLSVMMAFIPIFFYPLIGKWMMLVFLTGFILTVALWLVLNSSPDVDKQLCFLTRHVNYLCDKHVESDFKNIHQRIGNAIGDRVLYEWCINIYYVVFLMVCTYLKFIS